MKSRILSAAGPLQFGVTARLPVILQGEAAECGLACLAMIAGYHGLRTDLVSLRRSFPVSLKGASLKSIIEVARGIKLTARPLKLELSNLAALSGPSILHWNMTHFVVLKSVTAKTVTIHDPAVGQRTLLLKDIGVHFTGVAVEFTPAVDFTPREIVESVRLSDLLGRVVGLRRGLLEALVLALCLEAIAIAGPFFMQWVVDQVIVAGDRPLLALLGSGFIFLVALQTVIGALRSWVVTVLSTSLNFQWLGNVFRHLLDLPMSYFDRRHLGDILSRLGSITRVPPTLTTGFLQGVIDGALAVGTLFMMLLYSPKLALAACVAVAVYALMRWAAYRPLRDATNEQILHVAKQQTHFLETLRGVQALKLFSRQEERRIGWVNALAEQFNADLRIQRIGITYQSANVLLFGVERIVIVWLGALAVLDGAFSVGMLFAFVSYKEQFSQRVSSLVDKIFEIKMLRLHLCRVADIVKSTPEESNTVRATELIKVTPTIEIKSASFRYSPGEPYVLRAADLVIHAGECVAIRGPSGGGKTTLVKLLVGLLEPTEGEIRVGGFSLAQLGLVNYRRLVGAVMQDDELFSGSVADNISFFDPVPNAKRIEECARVAAIHGDVAAMPLGYDTLVGEMGVGMSGGQKQRILLARALYKQPQILVLDEATSHLDSLTEAAINNAISAMDLTRVIVAHRAETIAMASRVLTLERGALYASI